MSHEVLINTIKILNENKIDYWLCHGTLLGIIRENRILPWDHDIDFAVWKDTYDRAMIENIFDNHIDYRKVNIPQEVDSLHYIVGQSRVDINFYSRDNGLAYIRWLDPGNLETIFLSGLLRALDKRNKFHHLIRSQKKTKMMLKIIFFSIMRVFLYLISKRAQNFLRNWISQHITYLGYSYPLKLMKFKEFTFEKEMVVIPAEPEIYLEMTYGKDWHTPKENYVWNTEAKNLFMPKNAK